MSDRLSIPGSASVRSQLGIVAEDPRIFRPYAVEELSSAAEILARDESISDHVRRLIPIGVVYDLRPAHLMPRVEQVAGTCGFAMAGEAGEVALMLFLYRFALAFGWHRPA